MSGATESTPPASAEANAAPSARGLAALLGVPAAELPAIAAGFTMFLLAAAGYFLLRPVRDALPEGTGDLPWMFTATFVATLVVIPLYGLLSTAVARRRILAWTYGFLALNLLVFAALLAARPDDVWIARALFVWLSTFNLLTISVGWSVLADLFPSTQAARLFAPMAAGISTGGLVGPLLGVALVRPLGIHGLLVVSAALLVASIAAAAWLQRWRDSHPLPADAHGSAGDGASGARTRPLGGNPLAGLVDVVRSPYLLGIAAFVVLLASVTTFLYFEQARLVELHFPDRDRQVQVFGWIDAAVQALALLTQLFVTGRLVRRLGLVVLLATVPLAMAAGFLWLAFVPTFGVLVAVMIARRAGEYALARPGREMLFTVVPPAAKYKAKNVVDTAVYRGADAVSAWVRAGIDAIATHPAVVMVAGAGLALAWAVCGVGLARGHARRQHASTIADRERSATL